MSRKSLEKIQREAEIENLRWKQDWKIQIGTPCYFSVRQQLKAICQENNCTIGAFMEQALFDALEKYGAKSSQLKKLPRVYDPDLYLEKLLNK